jgi:hypothetical protein
MKEIQRVSTFDIFFQCRTRTNVIQIVFMLINEQQICPIQWGFSYVHETTVLPHHYHDTVVLLFIHMHGGRVETHFSGRKQFSGCELGNPLAIGRALRILCSSKICQTLEKFTNMTLDIIGIL